MNGKEAKHNISKFLDATKARFKGKFIALSVYIKKKNKELKSVISAFILKKLKVEEQMKLKSSR